MTTQAVATTQPKPALTTGGNVAAIIPRSLEETFRLAGAIAASGMAPSTLNSPEKVMVAIIAGAELGMPPFQSLQSFAVINGRPSLWGDGLIAVVRSHGFKVKEWLEGEEDAMVAHCEVTRPDSGEVIPGEFSVADAKKADLWGKTGPWQTNPKRMLKMRARGFACRDGAADVLRGFQLREEVEDYQQLRDVPVARPAGLAERLALAAPTTEGFTASQAEGDEVETVPHDADGVVDEPIIDAEIEDAADDAFPGDKPPSQQVADAPAQDGLTQAASKPTIAERVAAFRKRMGEATNPTKLKSIRKAADNLFDDMEQSDPEGRVELAFDYEERLGVLEQAERAERQEGSAQ